jgi:hypothetical protein
MTTEALLPLPALQWTYVQPPRSSSSDKVSDTSAKVRKADRCKVGRRQVQMVQPLRFDVFFGQRQLPVHIECYDGGASVHADELVQMLERAGHGTEDDPRADQMVRERGAPFGPHASQAAGASVLPPCRRPAREMDQRGAREQKDEQNNRCHQNHSRLSQPKISTLPLSLSNHQPASQGAFDRFLILGAGDVPVGGGCG